MKERLKACQTLNDMGHSEFAFPVDNAVDLQYWLDVVEAHNSCPMAGERLKVRTVLEFKSRKFLTTSNMGGRQATRDFLSDWCAGQSRVFIDAFAKPPGWFQCKDYVWTATQREDRPGPEIFDRPSAMACPDERKP